MDRQREEKHNVDFPVHILCKMRKTSAVSRLISLRLKTQTLTQLTRKWSYSRKTRLTSHPRVNFAWVYGLAPVSVHMSF